MQLQAVGRLIYRPASMLRIGTAAIARVFSPRHCVENCYANIFAASDGALTLIAAGMFAVVSLGCERIIGHSKKFVMLGSSNR
jgi:hypothetical protein